MRRSGYTHVAFADESNWNQGRFRSISLVSAAVEDARAFHQELDALRQSHGRTEYKWKDAKRRHGIALADFFFAHHSKMRVDVIVWDIEDARHRRTYPLSPVRATARPTRIVIARRARQGVP